MNIKVIVYLILTLHGTFMVGAYFMSMPILYNLHVFDNTTYMQEDVPGVLAIIELCFAFSSLIIYNVSYFLSNQEEREDEEEDKQTSKVLVGFYAAFFLGSIVFAIIRMGSLGITYNLNLSTVSQGTCADIDWQTGCPTTRFKEYSTQITNKEQCIFNAYGGKNKILTDKFTNDWSVIDNYDALKRSNLVSNANNALNLAPVNNVCDIGTITTDKTRCEIAPEDLPEIHWCWYWGCDKVCNQRYKINQTWLALSWFNAFFYLAIAIYLIISICE